MEEFLNQISLNLDQSNFTLAKDACLMLGSQKSLIHDEFGEKNCLTSFSKKDASCNAFLWASQACEIAQVFELLTIDKEYLIYY